MARSASGLTLLLWAGCLWRATRAVHGYVTAPAFFCKYNCSASARVSHPGKCFLQDQIFETRNVSWMKLTTRASEGIPIPPLLDEWAAYSAQDMTWEGWFHVKAPPRPERSMLIGTFGTNDHDALYSGLNRRRHGALWLEADGSVGMSTNTGKSSGSIKGPNVVDGRWHHLAAIWNRTEGGGAMITRSYKYYHVQFSVIINRPAILADLEENIKRAVAAEANATVHDVWVYFEDLQVRLFEGRTGVTWTVNCAAETVDMTMARLIRSDTYVDSMMFALMNTTSIDNAFTGLKLPVESNVELYDNELPTFEYLGTANLFVDGYEHKGRITYSPLEENIADNGQFLIGGGHQGRPVDCELSRVRIWNVALTQDQLFAIIHGGCTPPDEHSFIGGEWPYGLHGSWTLGGNLENSFGPMANLTEQSAWEEQIGPLGTPNEFNYVDNLLYPYWKHVVTGEAIQVYTNDTDIHLSFTKGGRFIRGGACNVDACPSVSPDLGCPLERSLNFDSAAECEAFASWNFCKLSGSSRSRPSMQHLGGCHVGAA